MGYKVNYGALDDLLRAYSTAVAQWSDGISSVMGKEAVIEASSFISGNSADRMKEYLNTAYSFAETSLSLLLEMFRQNFLLYIEAYYQQVDSERHTYINEAELTELRSSLQGKRSQLQQIGIAAENSVRGILDLVSLPNLDISEPDMKLGSMLTSLDELDNAVNGLERAHVSADFSDIDALISQLDAYFQELIGLSKEFKTDFTIGSFVSLSSVPALLMTTKKAYEHLTAQETNVALAAKNLEKRLELEQAELEKRQKQAKVLKILTYAAVAIGSAVVIAAFPAASPVIIGMASGMITSTVSASADEYVKHGLNMEQWDKGRIGAHACIGTVTGMIGGSVGPEAGIFAKASVKGVSSALEGAATSSYDQLATHGRITDTKAILVDAAEKGGAAFAGGLVGGAISENVKTIGISSLDKAMDDPLSKTHSLSVFLFEGGKSLGTGVISRGVSNLTGQVITHSADGTPIKLDELDLTSVSKDMFSPESLGKDFVVSGVSGAASDYVELRTPDPDSGLTPIIQFKLGNTPDPETGTAPIVDEALRGLEQKEQWEKSHLTDWHTTDWENTASSPEEILQLEEMERNGELEIPRVNPDLAEPERGTPHLPSGSGVFSGERGNSAFYPNDPAVVEHMRTYGQDYVEYNNGEVDFSPFTRQDSPWGSLDCQVEIGHMTDQRENPTWEYGRRPAGTSHDPNYDLGNFAQADNALLEKIQKIDPGATIDDVADFKASHHLTWHECADGKTMQLVPTDIHDASRHSGGVSEMKYRMAMGNIELPDE